MEGEALANRPESPKKKIKSSPVVGSEAESSNYPDNEADGHSPKTVNGLGAPSRKGRAINIPDSSCDASTSSKSTENCIPRVQEEVVSSSENSVGKVTETEETTICDSPSLDSTSDSTEKH